MKSRMPRAAPSRALADRSHVRVVTRDHRDAETTLQPATAAKAVDVAVVFVRDYSSEGSDRSTLELSGNQDALIESVAAVNPHTVVVLETGAPALMPWLDKVSSVATDQVTRTTGPVQLTATPAQTMTAAGKSVNVTTRLRNRSDYNDTNARVSVAAPSGWSVKALTPTTTPTLKPGTVMIDKFSVAIPAGTTGGTDHLTVSSTGTVHGERATSTTTLTVTVPYASLTAAYDTVGLTDDAHHAPGNWDPSGYSYSAQGLAAAGVTPGSTVTVDGSTVAFPSQAPGTPDAVTATGQVIAVNAKTAHLVILGGATFNEVSAKIHVTYTDGTSTDVPVDFSDWYSNAATAGSSIIATTRWNAPAGVADHDVSIYGSVAAVDATKTIATVTLPNSVNLHLFTVSPETTG